jgi:hypothetical protein
MRVIAMILALLLAIPAPVAVAAPIFDDPKALVEYAYLPYRSGRFSENIYELYSPSLIALFEANAARTPDDEVGAVNFDPLINAQDYDIDDIVISAPLVEGDNALVIASFNNFGEPQEIRFTLVRRAEGWKIDDIETLSEPYPWRLSELLSADPPLNQAL